MRKVLWICLLFAVLKLLITVAGNIIAQHAGYGIFRDELYLLVCGRHLAFGYVDQPFLSPLQARVSDLLFGHERLWAFRLLSTLAGCAKVFLTGILAWALGGGRRAAALSMLGVLTAGVYLGVDSYLSMNSFEPVFWMTCVLALVQLSKSDLPRPHTRLWWLVLGVSAGIGLENKSSEIFYLVCLLLALLLTSQRRVLKTRWFPISMLLIFLLVLPYLVWQLQHGFPTLEWLRQVSATGKDVKLSPPRFLLAQFIMLSPPNLLLWGVGIAWLLLAKSARRFHFLGIAYLLFLAVMMAMHAKDYYLSPAYPVLFAAGGVAWSNWAADRRWRTAALIAFAGLAAASMCVFLPFSIPILPPAQYVAYAKRLHFQPADTEVEASRPLLPQFYADRFGWRDLAGQVTRIYRALPESEQRITGIFASNYGEASAVTVLAPTLPQPISGHQNYWIWGPRGFTGKEMIIIAGATLDEMLQIYGSCAIVGRMDNPYSMPYEHRPIFLCRDRKVTYQMDWLNQKAYR